MARRQTFNRLDLIEMRRQLVHARNRHGNNPAIVGRINKLLCRIYHLDAARDRDQDAQIRKALRSALRHTGGSGPTKKDGRAGLV